MTIRHGERHDGDGLTYRAIRHIQAQPKLNMPAILCLDSVDDTGVIATWYFWADHTGAFRKHSALPTNQDGDGTVFGMAAGASASLALDNLSAVAINTSLISDTSNTDDLGSAAIPWRRAYLGTSAVFGLPAGNTLTISYAVPAVSRVVTFQDPGAAADVAYVGVAQTLTNKTLTSPVLTTPEINNLAGTFQYIFAPSALAADRIVTLPLLGAGDTFVFAAFAQTLTNKAIDGDDNTLTDLPLTQLKIAGQLQGDIIYFNGTNWTRLVAGTANYYLKTGGAGANPSWDQPALAMASTIAQTTVAEAGASDYTLHFNSPAAARHLDVNDPLGDDAFVFVAAAQTLTNKTLTSPVLTTPQINNVAATFQYVFVASALAADRNVTLPLLAGDDTFVFADFIQTLTNKTLTSPVLTTPQINNVAGTFQYVFVPSALAADRNVTLPLLAGDDTFVFADFIQTLTNKTLTSPVLTTPEINNLAGTFQYVVTPSAIAADRVATLPLLAGDDIFVFADFIQTLTNKTIAAASNTITGLGTTNTDHIAGTNATHGIPFILIGVNTGAASVKVTDSAPVKLRVLDAWAIATKACSGTWQLKDNGSTAITATVSYGADKALTRANSIDSAQHTITAGQDLYLISSDGTDTAIVYVLCIQVD